MIAPSGRYLYYIHHFTTANHHRLHDLRSNRPFESTFRDSTDHNPVYNILPFGHDRFVVGAGGDAVIKLFDLRTPNAYNYLNVKPGPPPQPQSTTHPRKDFSLFLSQPLPTPRRARNNAAYRGPIYTLSTPSPSSPSIYAGIVDGVFRLDFSSTDDLIGPHRDWYRENLALDLHTNKSAPDRVLQMSGYERPDADDVTSSVKLRTQVPFECVGNEHLENELVTGWDRRWEGLDAGKEAWRRRRRGDGFLGT